MVIVMPLAMLALSGLYTILKTGFRPNSGEFRSTLYHPFRYLLEDGTEFQAISRSVEDSNGLKIRKSEREQHGSDCSK